MDAEDASALRGFTRVFAEVNGREPSVDENKRALALRRAVRDAGPDFDPTLLFFIADANANAERARIPGAVKSAVDQGVKRLSAAIPASGELAAAMGDVRAINATFDRLSKVMAAVWRAAAVAVVVALAIAFWGWRWGYGAGWAANAAVRYKSWNQGVCEGLATVRHDLRSHRGPVQALDRERVSRGC